MDQNKKLRYGQAVFNTMHDLNPNVANKFRGSDYDPFYDDGKVDAFIQKCLEETK